MSVTRTELLATFKEQCIALYPWAKDEEKLTKFLESARRTLAGEACTWIKDGPAWFATMRHHGLPKSMSMKALRGLPQ